VNQRINANQFDLVNQYHFENHHANVNQSVYETQTTFVNVTFLYYLRIINKNKMEIRTANIKFLDLCEEIDYWKDRARKAEKDAEHWQTEYTKHVNEGLASAQKGVANALMFALSVRDDEDGNLVIDKDKRQKLAENLKTE
jgi:hypothetical protein